MFLFSLSCSVVPKFRDSEIPRPSASVLNPVMIAEATGEAGVMDEGGLDEEVAPEEDIGADIHPYPIPFTLLPLVLMPILLT